MIIQPVSLGELLTLVRRKVDVVADGQYPEIGVRSYGRGLFHKQPRSGLEVGDKELFLVHEGDFILQVTFAWEGAVAVAQSEDHGLYGSVRMLTFRVDENRCLPEFLQFYFRTPEGVEQLVRISPGSAGRNRVLNKSRLPEVFVPLPPLAEQRRIVAKIERLAGKIEEAQGLREITYSLTENLLERGFKAKREELLHAGIPTAQIGQITQVTAGGTPPRDVAAYWNGHIPWIKTGELVDGDIDQAKEHISEFALAKSSAKLFPPDTVLIALYGQGQTRGRTGRLRISAATNQACCAILPAPDLLDARFTQYWLRSYYSELREDSHGGAQPNWNGSMIKRLPIALPSLEVQRDMVDYLDGFQAKIMMLKVFHAQTKMELDALLPALLDRAFKGEL